MKRVAIVGLGMSADTLTAEGLRAVQQAEILIGAPRLTAQFKALGKPTFSEYAPDQVARLIHESGVESVCVLVSGDTGFYSAADGLCAVLKDYELSLIPGVSSLSYFFARLMRPWQNAAVVSCHGRKANLTDAVRRSSLTFALTGGNMAELGTELTHAGFGNLTAYIGENLGMPEERILTLPVSELCTAGTRSLAVLLVENPGYDRRVRFGIPDGEFIRGDVPMTKAEVRAVTMSKLAPSPNAICCDIGAGTGSVTVEMALAAYEGRVYALDKNEEAVKLISANCRAFHIGNVTPVLGAAPEALIDLPPMDAAFIGGSSGRLREIFDVLIKKNPHIRIVINAVMLETLQEAMRSYAAHDIAPEIVQLGAAHTKLIGNRHMLQAGSPVYILSGGKRG